MDVQGHFCGVTELAVELTKHRSVAMNPLVTDWVLDIDFSWIQQANPAKDAGFAKQQ